MSSLSSGPEAPYDRPMTARPSPPPRSERRVPRRLGITLALGILAAVAGLAYQRLAQLRVDTEWNEHTHLVIETIEKTRVALLGADTMRRSYRMSFDPGDRDRMDARVAEAKGELDEGLVWHRDLSRARGDRDEPPDGRRLGPLPRQERGPKPRGPRQTILTLP
jgi:hypothetical protein